MQRLAVRLIITVTFLTIYGSVKASEPSGLFPIIQNDKCGYIGKTGEIIIPIKFEQCLDFSEGFAPVQLKGKWGFIDRSGNIAIPARFDEARWAFHEGLAAVKVGLRWGYIDKEGAFAITPQFD